MEAVSVSVEMSPRRHGSRVEEQKFCGQGSPDQETTHSCLDGRRKRVWGAELSPCGKGVIVIRSGVNDIGSERSRASTGARVHVVLLLRAAS